MSLYGRVVAAAYDRSLAGSERAGLRERRRRLLADAAGRVLEIGAGTGLNLDLYPTTLDELTLTEPDESMARRLERRLRADGRHLRVIRAPAERLPFDDASFDTVVSTLVLCTVSDPRAVLCELARVLAPGGRLLFLEHVRAQDPALARWQDRLHGPWLLLARGCHCNRPTADLLRASGLEVTQLEHSRMPKAPPIVRPLITGHAVAGR